MLSGIYLKEDCVHSCAKTIYANNSRMLVIVTVFVPAKPCQPSLLLLHKVRSVPKC